MGDPLEELRAEAKLRWEAQQAAEVKRKAVEDSLFELDRMPAPAQKQQEPAPAPKPAAAPAPAASASSAGPPAPQRQPPQQQPWQQQQREQPQLPAERRTPGQSSSSAGPAVYTPPNWATAGPRPAGAEDDPLMENEGISVPLCGWATTEGNPGQQLFALAGLHPPTEASFEHFFHDWFEQEHFPVMSKKLQKELQHRARSRGFFNGIASQVKGWAMKNTDERLQADVWCNYLLKNAPPQYRTIGCVRTAAVNLGSQVKPCWLTFYGYSHQGDQWVLPPWASSDVDCSALMDELDGRGGMTALLSAAA
mmetsp:Transcript_72265/g.164053  ORF Transcript_72265/g.164053 Transcript_72265/m.164053 type:complete len:308 (-) Transcript_72265:87-1010(-)